VCKLLRETAELEEERMADANGEMGNGEYPAPAMNPSARALPARFRFASRAAPSLPARRELAAQLVLSLEEKGAFA
jgi:hypothetical protein